MTGYCPLSGFKGTGEECYFEDPRIEYNYGKINFESLLFTYLDNPHGPPGI